MKDENVKQVMDIINSTLKNHCKGQFTDVWNGSLFPERVRKQIRELEINTKQ